MLIEVCLPLNSDILMPEVHVTDAERARFSTGIMIRGFEQNPIELQVFLQLREWFKILPPFFQPIRSETKTNRGSRVHIFPRVVSSVLFDWPK